MATRQTNTSMEAALFSLPHSQAFVTGANVVSTTAPTLHVVRSDPVQPSASETVVVSSASPAPVTGQASSLSPDIVALISQTVQAALQARDQAAQTPAISASSVALPASSTSLGSLTSSFLAAGTGFPSGQAASASPQGRPAPIVVPSFVSTFATPIPALASSSARSLSSVSLATPISLTAAQVPSSISGVVAEQPFVVGPGFSPIPAKFVSQIVSGKYVDLSELLAANLVRSDPEPQLLLDGRLVLTTPPKKQRRRIDDIASWTEAFTIFSLVLTTFFPQRWKDLTVYKLLILRLYRHFSGRVWFAYDQAFREHAAATRLLDWSGMDAQLFNFHAAGASVRSSGAGSAPDSSEPSGSSSSLISCISWNKGRCTAPYATCRYHHRCSTCSGSHRALFCPNRSERKPQSDGKRRARSPAAGSSPTNKSRRQ